MQHVFLPYTNPVHTQAVIRQALTSSTALPAVDAEAPPPLPPGSRQRHQEIKAQICCRTHARSMPYSSAKRW